MWLPLVGKKLRRYRSLVAESRRFLLPSDRRPRVHQTRFWAKLKPVLNLEKEKSKMNIVGLIIQLVSGGVGATAAAGTAAAGGGLDFGSIVSSIAGGGVGGSILMIIVGLIKSKMGGS